MKKHRDIKAFLFIFMFITIVLISFKVSSSYIYPGYHWPTADATALPIYVNNVTNVPAGIDYVGCTQASIAKWNNVSSSFFRFDYKGTTTAYNWTSTDGINSYIFYVNTGDPKEDMDSTELGTNKYWYNTSTKLITECDIRINANGGDISWTWSKDEPTGARKTYDLQHVVTHESGHSLHLADIYDSAYSSSMMYGYYHASRDLAQDDIDGITAIYPSGSPMPTATPTTSPTVTPVDPGSGGGGGGGGGCFIATAAYGSYMHDDVMVLRNFRDDVLLKSSAGRAFVDSYYATSPPVADAISQSPSLKAIARASLFPLVYGLKHPPLAFLGLLSMIFAAVLIRKKLPAVNEIAK